MKSSPWLLHTLIWFVEVDRGFLFFVVVAEECCGLGFGGQDNLMHTRGFSVCFALVPESVDEVLRIHQ